MITSWRYAVSLRNGTVYDDTFGIYRPSLTGRDLQLLKMSDIINPENGSVVHLEMIPHTEQPQDKPPQDIYCLSKFEYRSQEFEIVFNAIEVVPVSTNGKFCDVRSDSSLNNSCHSYYLNLHYASIDIGSGNIERFNDRCVGSKIYYSLTDLYSYNWGGVFGTGDIYPRLDSGLNVSSYISRKGFPSSGERLVVYYPNIPLSVLFFNITNAGQMGLEIRMPVTNGNNFCVVKLRYNYLRSAVVYNFWGVTNRGRCWCDQSSPSCSAMLNQTAVYGYLKNDSQVVPLTECSSIPYQNLVPLFDSSLSIPCSC